jgi:hypothetical protein
MFHTTFTVLNVVYVDGNMRGSFEGESVRVSCCSCRRESLISQCLFGAGQRTSVQRNSRAKCLRLRHVSWWSCDRERCGCRGGLNVHAMFCHRTRFSGAHGSTRADEGAEEPERQAESDNVASSSRAAVRRSPFGRVISAERSCCTSGLVA